jgi:HlyD family secretion protein
MSSKWMWIGLVLAVVAGAGLWLARGGDEAEGVLRGAKVRRGALKVAVVQRGNLAAKDANSVKSEVEGQSTILWLVPEGTQVKPGDLLVELDASDLVDKKVAQEISVQNAEASYQKAKAQFDIQESQNRSDIEAAERKLAFARIDKEKYEAADGDYAQLFAAAEEKIKLAEGELAKSQNTYDWSKQLAEKGFLTKSELDRDELDFQRAQVSLDQARRNKQLLVDYDAPRKRAELEADLREAQRGLDRAQLEATSKIVDYQAALGTSKSKLDLEKEKLAKYVDQLAKSKIKSSTTGMVVYARVEGGGRMGGSEPIQEGTTVRERQEILSIPTTGGLIVEASIHESVLKQVSIGKTCAIQVDALPGQAFKGRVQFVALLPDKGSWWANPNQRLYRTEIAVEDGNVEMRPGMSCSVEILADMIDDCLQVPVQSVVLHEGRTISFVASATGAIEERAVKVGRASETFVEVVEGLREGEEVLLAPPPGFTPKGAPEAEGGRSGGGRPGPAGGGAGAARGGPGADGAMGGGRNQPGAGGDGAGGSASLDGGQGGAGQAGGGQAGGGQAGGGQGRGMRGSGRPRGDQGGAAADSGSADASTPSGAERGGGRPRGPRARGEGGSGDSGASAGGSGAGGSGAGGSGAAGPSASGTGASGTSASGSSASGTGAVGSGAADSGAAGSGAGNSGDAGSGVGGTESGAANKSAGGQERDADGPKGN